MFFLGRKNNVNTSFTVYFLDLEAQGTLQHRLVCYFPSLGNTKIFDFHRILVNANA